MEAGSPTPRASAEKRRRSVPGAPSILENNTNPDDRTRLRNGDGLVTARELKPITSSSISSFCGRDDQGRIGANERAGGHENTTAGAAVCGDCAGTLSDENGGDARDAGRTERVAGRPTPPSPEAAASVPGPWVAVRRHRRAAKKDPRRRRSFRQNSCVARKPRRARRRQPQGARRLRHASRRRRRTLRGAGVVSGGPFER